LERNYSFANCQTASDKRGPYRKVAGWLAIKRSTALKNDLAAISITDKPIK